MKKFLVLAAEHEAVSIINSFSFIIHIIYIIVCKENSQPFRVDADEYCFGMYVLCVSEISYQ